MAISFNLNGSTVSVQSEADTPLLWVIRDEVGLTGTKFGCGAALCGACTVHLNGTPIRACQTPVSAVAGKKVATVESPVWRQLASAAESVDQASSASMWLLPVGSVDECCCAAVQEQKSKRRRHRQRDERQSLPLRYLQPHSRRDQGCSCRIASRLR